MENIPYEIERKFLIAYPDSDFIKAVEDNSSIVQTYLKSENGISERVRKRGKDGKFVFTHTVKKRISDVRRIEFEDEISQEEYLELLNRADSDRNVIYKNRLCYYYNEQMFEIDLYPFWSDRAVMELELKDEAQSIDFPKDIHIIKEISSDRRYTNASMAREIPQDEI